MEERTEQLGPVVNEILASIVGLGLYNVLISTPLTCNAVDALIVDPVRVPVTPSVPPTVALPVTPSELLKVAAPVTDNVPHKVVLPVPTTRFLPVPIVKVLLHVVAEFIVVVVPPMVTLFQKVAVPLKVPAPVITNDEPAVKAPLKVLAPATVWVVLVST